MKVKSFAHVATVILAMPLTAILLCGCMPYSTGTMEVGVRTIKWSPTGKKGVEEKVYAPGSTHFFVPIINDWHTFYARQVNLEMVAESTRGDRRERDDLLFKTIDGNDISLDVIVTYHIDQSKAWRILKEVAESDAELKENIVRTLARSKARDIFGELRTEEFYIADKRSAKEEEVKGVLTTLLEPYGVVVERVATRNYTFNPAYQKAIEDRKIADQQAAKFKSATDAAKEEYLRRIEEAKGDVGKVKAEADGEYQRAVIEADAYYEQQQRLSEAILAEGQAEAEGMRKMNEALSGTGGEALVKMEMADALKGKRIMLLPIGGGGLDLRTTDVNSLLQVYGLQQLGAGNPPAKR